jgi:hypothetical protein
MFFLSPHHFQLTLLDFAVIYLDSLVLLGDMTCLDFVAGHLWLFVVISSLQPSK